MSSLLRPLNPLYAVLLLLPIARAAVGETSDDFSVSGEVSQNISTDAVHTALIRCFCPDREILRDSAAKGITLRIRGTNSSVGYHGPQEKPTRLDESLLRFVERRDGPNLILESREYTYIHHALILDRVEIVAPPGLDVTVTPLQRKELEGRRVRQ